MWHWLMPGRIPGVIQDGLSVLVSKEGICFRKEQHQVNLVFCFASTGEKEYLDLIKEIVAVGKEQKRLKRILKCKYERKIYHALIFGRVRTLRSVDCIPRSLFL